MKAPIIAALALFASPANAAVVYELSVETELFGGFIGTARIELPRYLVQPDPPKLKNYQFVPGDNVACTTSGSQCSNIFLSAVRSFTGEYVVVGAIESELINHGVIFRTARLDTNGQFFGSFNDNKVRGVLTISGAPTYIPEPASWALMIGGFALAGAAVRRRASRGASRITLYRAD